MGMFEKLGEYSFLACIVIAIVAGIATSFANFSFGWEASALVILGVIVGFTRKTDSESDFQI